MNQILMLIAEAEFVPDPTKVTAGWLGGLFFFGLFAVVFLLWWNMNSRIKRLNQDGFTNGETTAQDAAAVSEKPTSD